MKKRMIVNKKRVLGPALLFLAVFTALILCFGGMRAAALPEQTTAYYTAVTVQQGDSLWSIAKQYAPAYSDVRDYLELLRAVNGLHRSDLLQAGQTLIIVYYQ